MLKTSTTFKYFDNYKENVNNIKLKKLRKKNLMFSKEKRFANMLTNLQDFFKQKYSGKKIVVYLGSK